MTCWSIGNHVIIAGFGLAGRNLARVLRGVDIPYVVLRTVIESCLVTASSPAIEKSITELRLRALSGATILAARREGTDLVNPDPEIRLAERDVVVLFGDRSQLVRRSLAARPRRRSARSRDGPAEQPRTSAIALLIRHVTVSAIERSSSQTARLRAPEVVGRQGPEMLRRG